MDYVRMFLKGREVFMNCGNGLEKVTVDEALKLMDKCTIYASLAKNSKATPALGVFIEKDVDWYILLTVSVYVASLVKSLGLESTYVAFYWLGSQVLVHEDSIPLELFKRFSKPIEAGYAISNYILKTFEDKLAKISRFFKSRIWFSTELDKVIAPCSFIPEVRKKAIYIGINNTEELELKVREELCTIGEPFKNKGLSQAIEHKLLNNVTASVNVKPMVVRSSSGTLPKVVGRFEVMALLQAARYYALSRDLGKAKSFGLNRAVFYAWAKYYRPIARRIPSQYVKPSASDYIMRGKGSSDKAVEDKVDVKNGYFVFSDQVQTPEDFDRSIKHKIDAVVPFDIVWDLTLKYVKMFRDDILRDPNRFYKYVYEPVRDSYMERIEDIIKAMPRDNVKNTKRENVQKAEEDVQLKPRLKKLTEYISSNK